MPVEYRPAYVAEQIGLRLIRSQRRAVMRTPEPFKGGYVVLTRQPDGSWRDDWDGRVHVDRADGAESYGEAVAAIGAENAILCAVLPDQPDHFITFDESGWLIEHSVACRFAGTIGTCEATTAMRRVPDGGESSLPSGRFRVTSTDRRGGLVLVPAPKATQS